MLILHQRVGSLHARSKLFPNRLFRVSFFSVLRSNAIRINCYLLSVLLGFFRMPSIKEENAKNLILQFVC